ncbi:MAG: SurA N-terminal domain-containing protein, partial [Candidatus Omnitrophota bacterium]
MSAPCTNLKYGTPNRQFYSGTTPWLILLLCLFPPLRGYADVSILAQVGNEIIISIDLKELVQSGISRKDALEKLVEERLFFLEAKRQKLSVSEKEVQEEFERTVNRFPNPADFYQKLAEADLTPSFVCQRIARQILVRKLIQEEITAKVTVTPVELSHYLQQHQPEMLLEEGEVHLAEAHFATRKEIPDDRNTLSGMMRDLGIIPFRNLSDAVREAIVRLKPGDISDIIMLDNSYTVFKLLEIKLPETFDRASLALKAKQQLFRTKFNAAYQDFLARLKDK